MILLDIVLEIIVIFIYVIGCLDLKGGGIEVRICINNYILRNIK